MGREGGWEGGREEEEGKKVEKDIYNYIYTKSKDIIIFIF